MATIEEELKMIKTAHARLFNQFNQLSNDYEKLVKIVGDNYNHFQSINTIMWKEIELKKPAQPKEVFKDANNYTSTIENIVTIEETNWNNNVYLNMEVKLIGREELYKVFVLKGNKPDTGNKIRFTFDATDNKLKKLKVL